ncbi:hypothetical protein INS49_010878 [Diaporthe citri]|uniref:uncharacterized protein n=1 Tax=Diaporthe citri TaxID=83186 RepID=UPI001C7FF024|nr:uncharacterized protein INS49_010878 [Diaporthe citri]KAG6359825.1 hypothetical protein INS49_010878 [Diaporthe citri]
MRNGPTCLKPLPAGRKRIKKLKKNELTPWPFDESFASPLKATTTTTTVKNGKMGKDKVQKTPTTGPSKPSAATKTGTMAASKVQKKPTTGPTLPKELIEKHTLSVTPQSGADMEELEEAIRKIESPCGNMVWSESWVKERTRGSGPTTLDINIIYNDCSGRKTMPYSCRKNRTVYGATKRDLPSHSDALKMEDVIHRVRDMDDLVAA